MECVSRYSTLTIMKADNCTVHFSVEPLAAGLLFLQFPMCLTHLIFLFAF